MDCSGLTIYSVVVENSVELFSSSRYAFDTYRRNKYIRVALDVFIYESGDKAYK